MHIAVSNLNGKRKINERFIGRIAGAILKSLKKREIELEIVFLSDAGILPFNRRYKNSGRATDVLSFDLGACALILISSDMALRNSRIFHTPFERELVLYLLHGILHLFGYDDETPGEKARMFKKQDIIMEKLCAKIKLSKVLTPR